MEQGPQYWLMKAEPNSRIEKGKDVKVSRYYASVAGLPIADIQIV